MARPVVPDRTHSRRDPAAESGQSLVEVMVALVLFSLVAIAVGTALGTGGDIYSEGVMRADRDSAARQVLNRVLTEISEARADSPSFDVGPNYITYDPIESLTATDLTFGEPRIIQFEASSGRIYMAIPDLYLVEDLTSDATSFRLTLNGSLLTATVSIRKEDGMGGYSTQTVTGATHVRH